MLTPASKKLWQEAQDSIRRQEWDQVIALLTELISQEPVHAEAYRERGSAYAKKGEHVKSIADFDKALELDPDDAVIRYEPTPIKEQTVVTDQGSLNLWQKALDAVQGREWDQAIALLTEFVSLEPHNAEAYRKRGSIYAKQGEHAKSIADFDMALGLDPDDALVRYDPGAVGGKTAVATQVAWNLWQKALDAVRDQEWDQAIAFLTEFIAMQPDHAEAYRKRGIAYAKKGEHERSIADYDKALALEPEDAPVRYDPGAAKEQAEKKQAAPPDRASRELWQKALKAFRGQEWDQVIALLSEFISMNPNHADAYRKRGRAYAKQGEQALSRADYDKVRELGRQGQDTALGQGRQTATEPSAASVASTAPLRTPEETWEEAEEAFKRKEWDKVTVLMTQYIVLNPSHSEAYRKRGYAYSAKGDHARAVADCEKALELSPENAQAHYDLGLLTQAAELSPVARGGDTAADDAGSGRGAAKKPKFPPEDSVPHYDLGLGEEQALAEQTVALTQVLEDPLKKARGGDTAGDDARGDDFWGGDTRGDNVLAPEPTPKDLEELEDFASKDAEQDAEQEDVTVYYERTLIADHTVEPTQSPEDLLQTIQGAINRKEWDEVISALTEYISLNPNHAEVYKNRGTAYAAKGEHDLAIADYGKALRLSPKYAEAYRNRGAVYVAKGEYDRAISDYGNALRWSPKDAGAYKDRAATYARKGDYARAISDYDKVLKLSPRDVEAYKNRGAAYAGKDAHDRAIEDYDKALELSPKDAGAYKNRGAAYAAKGEHDRAIWDYDQALELSPEDAEAHYERGAAYAGKGDYARAIEDCDRALELAPEDAAAHQRRGGVYALQGEYEPALSDYGKALELSPEDVAAYQCRGGVYVLQGEYESALSDYGKALELAPEDAGTYFLRGNAYFQQGDYDRAVSDYDQVLERRSKDAEAYKNRGAAYARKGLHGRAIEDYGRALGLAPGDAEIYKNRGLSYAARGDYGRALSDCDKALELAPEDAEAYYNRGNAYAGKGDHDRAVSDYNKVLERRPEDAAAYCKRGAAYVAKGEYDYAIEDCDKALELAPEYAAAYKHRGRAYAGKGDYTGAVSDCNKALELAPEDAGAYKYRAAVYIGRGDYARAVSDCDKALALEPEDAEAYKYRSAAHAGKGDYARAIKDCDKALELAPEDAEAYKRRGTAHAGKGDYARAIEDCDKALELAPEDAGAYRNRGAAHAGQGDYARAIEDCDKALELAPEDAEAYKNRGAAHAGRGDYARAIEDCDKALELAPGDAAAYYDRGSAYANTGDYTRAISDYFKVLELDPKNDAAYYNRGTAYTNKGDYARAISDYSRALELVPEYVAAYYNRGIAYAGKGDYAQAVSDYDKALEFAPENAKAYYNRGTAYARQGDYERAISDYGQVLELAPENARAYNNRGAAYVERGEYDSAIWDCDKTLALAPEDAAAYYNRGVAYAKKGDHERAIADYAKAFKNDKDGAIARFSPFDAFFLLSSNEVPAEQRAEMFRRFHELRNATRGLQREAFAESRKRAAFAVHYTSVSAVCPLVDKAGRFRLYNAANLKDPEEGRALFEAMDQGGDCRREFYGEDDGRLEYSPVYIGSFLPGQSPVAGDSDAEDAPPLWRLYGQDQGRGAAGCSLSYPDRLFAKETPADSVFSAMLPYTTGSTASVSRVSPLALFAVFYEDDLEKIRGPLGEMQAALEKIRGLKKDQKYREHISFINACTRGLLDEVRFLCKRRRDPQEQEIRLVQMRYMLPEETAPAIEYEYQEGSECPRLYVELSPEFRPAKVTLGPGVEAPGAWASFIERIKRPDETIEVRRSKHPPAGN